MDQCGKRRVVSREREARYVWGERRRKSEEEDRSLGVHGLKYHGKKEIRKNADVLVKGVAVLPVQVHFIDHHQAERPLVRGMQDRAKGVRILDEELLRKKDVRRVCVRSFG